MDGANSTIPFSSSLKVVLVPASVYGVVHPDVVDRGPDWSEGEGESLSMED